LRPNCEGIFIILAQATVSTHPRQTAKLSIK
jgi:hypothetical protein